MPNLRFLTHLSRPMDLISQLRTAIANQSLPTPSPAFLTQLTTARNPPPPIPSLLATAKARLLACDLTNGNIIDPLLPGFPAGIDSGGANVKEVKLLSNVFVQVLDVENLSVSRWEQVEELEAIERGERTRGRQVIRVADDDEDDEAMTSTDSQTQLQTQRNTNTNTTATSSSSASVGPNATHRLILQDRHAKRIFAIELKRIPRIGVGKTFIGEKMLIRAGTSVARGTMLLSPENCVLLGGKIDAWHESWMEGRLARLRGEVGR